MTYHDATAMAMAVQTGEITPLEAGQSSHSQSKRIKSYLKCYYLRTL